MENSALGAATELLAPVSNNIAHTKFDLNSSLSSRSSFWRLRRNCW